MKCINSWCDNEVIEGMGNLCLKCEDIYYDAVMEMKERDRIREETDNGF